MGENAVVASTAYIRPNQRENASISLQGSFISVFSRASDPPNNILPVVPKTKILKNDSNLRQQRLRRWIHIVRFKYVGFYFPFSILLVMFGFYGVIVSNPFYSHDYTDCKQFFPDTDTEGNETCASIIERNPSAECKCRIKFKIDQTLGGENGEIILSYELRDFFGNQRQYLTSKDYQQLRGEIFENGKPVEPDPSRKGRKCIEEYRTNGGKIIYPCGMVANSYFTDTFKLLKNKKEINMTFVNPTTVKKNIYKNPSKDPKFHKSFTKPKEWTESVNNMFWEIGGVESSSFQIWSTASPLSDFTKPYKSFKGTLGPKDEIFCVIDYRFNSRQYGGRKLVVLSDNRFINHEHGFISTASLISGGIQFLLLLVCLSIWLRRTITRKRKVAPSKASLRTKATALTLSSEQEPAPSVT